MGKPVLSPEARRDLEEIGDYIAFELRNKAAAGNVIRGIRKTVESLREVPERGTPVYEALGEPLYRYLQSGNYLIFYTVSDSTAHIDRVLYAHRDYLAILFGIDSLEEES